MNGLEIFDILTRRKVFVRVSNLKIDGVDESGQPIYSPCVKVTIGKGGVELATFIGTSLETELNNAYSWAIENNVVKDAPEYTAQCETCMRKLCGEILEVCKDSTDENRHCQWWGHESQDHCTYKIPWDKYPESYWRTILSPEQFALAKLLNIKSTK
ncbi:MAG: hypothetical protein NC110_00195 [Ruminococcus sp.]|nr:hypothetical protein [Ruminococcus sp.]